MNLPSGPQQLQQPALQGMSNFIPSATLEVQHSIRQPIRLALAAASALSPSDRQERSVQADLCGLKIDKVASIALSIRAHRDPGKQESSHVGGAIISRQEFYLPISIM
jgi:hypothetical protein